VTIAGEALTVRPLRPEDAGGLVDLVARTDAEDVRLRFRAGLRRLPEAWAERLSQVDYDREMALAAVDGAGEILGVARLAADPQGESAEFALLVRTDHQHRGIGGALMEALIAFAKGRGLHELWGETQRDNHRMLQLAEELGFRASAPKPGADPQYVRMALALA
jgi:acetyltransferase